MVKRKKKKSIATINSTSMHLQNLYYMLVPNICEIHTNVYDYIAYRDKVAACAKHYVGDGGTVKGINENDTIVSQHELYSIHMPAYYNSIIRGVSTIMASYSSFNGVKMHANQELLTGFLKNRLKFRVISNSVLVVFIKSLSILIHKSYKLT